MHDADDPLDPRASETTPAEDRANREEGAREDPGPDPAPEPVDGGSAAREHMPELGDGWVQV